MEYISTAQHRMNRKIRRERRHRRQAAGIITLICILLLGVGWFTFSREQAFRQERTGGLLTLNTEKFMNAPFIDQREKYPTGCESVSAVMALQYLGMEITPEEFMDSYLPRGNAPYTNGEGELVGCDPRKAFPGDPYSQEGWGCYAPVIEKAVQEAGAGFGISAAALTGESLEVLCRDYVAEGIPVLLWASIGMAPVTQGDTWRIEGSEEYFTWLQPLHCMLLTGWDEENYYFNDPMVGKNTAYPRAAVRAAYEALGEQSVIVGKKSELE